jgi:hypothetical protein
MDNRISYERLLEIKANDVNIKTIDILNHAYRINGVLDVYKNLNRNDEIVVFAIKHTLYHRFSRKVDAISFIKKFTSENGVEKTFSTKQNDKITFKSFMRNASKADWRPENYHWDASKNEHSSDDLYFIHDDLNRIKIGRTSSVNKRIRELQTANPNKLKLVFTIKYKGMLERQLHICFSELRLTGEWFTYTSRFDDFFKYVESSPYQVSKEVKDYYLEKLTKK